MKVNVVLVFSGHADPLPVGWKQFYEQGKTIFLNEQTGQRTFVDPRLGELFLVTYSFLVSLSNFR